MRLIKMFREVGGIYHGPNTIFESSEKQETGTFPKKLTNTSTVAEIKGHFGLCICCNIT